MAGEIAGARGTASAAAEPVAASSVPAAGATSHEIFAALDAADAPGRPAWIHAGAQRAEAGFQDPALGWVGVRADTSGGAVHAQLVPGSADAAQALDSQMAGLNAYLAEHHPAVETLTLTAPAGGWAGGGSDQGAGQAMQQGTGQQAGQETAQGADTGFAPSPSPSRTVLPAAASAIPAWSGGLDGSAQGTTSGGVHISVVA
jgi:hypothetical protein